MAFDPNKKNEQQTSEEIPNDVDKALEASRKDLQVKQNRPHTLLKHKHHESKKRYNFTLKPSNHTKLKQLCKEYGYASASELIDELIESL